MFLAVSGKSDQHTEYSYQTEFLFVDAIKLSFEK